MQIRKSVLLCTIALCLFLLWTRGSEQNLLAKSLQITFPIKLDAQENDVFLDSKFPRILPKLRTANPLVSIILPTYNDAVYLHSAISGVLAQTYQRWELIVINDGSTDDTDEILQAVDDKRVKVITQENKGKQCGSCT